MSRILRKLSPYQSFLRLCQYENIHIFRTSYAKMLSTAFWSCWNHIAWVKKKKKNQVLLNIRTDNWHPSTQKSNDIGEHLFASCQIACLPLSMKALSRKLGNVAEQKTCGLFSLLPDSLQCDLEQTTSCLSLCGTEVPYSLPSCAIYGQATMMMHTDQRWHTQYKIHTYLS